ncbi:RNA polymerase sigma factor [Streptomyces sp. NPDC050095]|uniref:RNA polymerase sigma factor n=1 Tax=unclassified Streptomyces TaxID=2593676 RepID=UPI0034273443
MQEEESSEPDLTAVAAGDRLAFEALYRRYAPWLVARLRYRCANESQLEDVVQETFVAVWRRCAENRQPEVRDIQGWLWQIASRRIADTSRTRGSQERLRSALHRLRRQSEPSAEDRVLSGLDHGDIADALARLSPDLREVVEATVLEGLSTNEAAARLRIPPGTVKTRAMRARRRLREELDDGRRDE